MMYNIYMKNKNEKQGVAMKPGKFRRGTLKRMVNGGGYEARHCDLKLGDGPWMDATDVLDSDAYTIKGGYAYRMNSEAVQLQLTSVHSIEIRVAQ